MAVMSMRQVLKSVNDSTMIKIYEGTRFITKGNWYQDNILDYARAEKVEADLDAETNVCTVKVPESIPFNEKDLEKRIRRYKLMDIHRTMVRNGELGAAQILLRMLRNGKVTLWLDDNSYTVETVCEEVGCHIYYDRRGYKAVAHL